MYTHTYVGVTVSTCLLLYNILVYMYICNRKSLDHTILSSTLLNIPINISKIEKTIHCVLGKMNAVRQNFY